MTNDPFATHQPVLKKNLSILDKNKPILELGCGHGSTPLLHDFSTSHQVEIYIFDNNEEWLNIISSQYKSHKYHNYIKVNDWNIELKEYLKYDWSLVFIDQAPWEARTLSLELFKNKTDYVILHDCDYFPANNVFGKQYSPIISSLSTGHRDYSDILKYYVEYFPKHFASPSGPPTLLGSQYNKIDFLIE